MLAKVGRLAFTANTFVQSKINIQFDNTTFNTKFRFFQ